MQYFMKKDLQKNVQNEIGDDTSPVTIKTIQVFFLEFKFKKQKIKP